MEDDPTRRMLNDRELMELQETGRVQTLGGFTLAALIASVNQLGIGPEDVEVVGTAHPYKASIELFVIDHETELESVSA